VTFFQQTTKILVFLVSKIVRILLGEEENGLDKSLNVKRKNHSEKVRHYLTFISIKKSMKQRLFEQRLL
jgi:hypothetical protein